MIGKIITARVVPAGLAKSGKGSGGANAAEYAEFIRQIAELAVGTGSEITQDQVEYALGTKASYLLADGKTVEVAKTLERCQELAKLSGVKVAHAGKPLPMPKCFLNNMRKRIAEKFGDDNNGASCVQMDKFDSGKGTRCTFQIWKGAVKADAPAS
jgi:hypothetical protein